jgi:hypothetical protein
MSAYAKDYKGTASIMLEDYSAMEGLVKQFLLIAPRIAAAAYAGGDPVAFKQIRFLQDAVAKHLES